MATKRGRKKAAKKSVRKRAARKSAKRVAKRGRKKAAKRATRARRPAPKRAKRRAPKRAARPRRKVRKPAKRAAAKRVAARRPAMKVVKRAAPRPQAKPARPARAVKPAFAGAKASASAKELALFELERARVALHAALQGMSAAAANTVMPTGRWTPRQLVLHLIAWDRESLGLLEAAYTRNQRPVLSAHENDLANDARVASLEHHDWEEARRLLQHARADLREAFDAIPEEPADVWSPDHAVGWFARFLAGHDWHHAETLKAARVAAPAEGA